MNAERWERMERILSEALERPPAERDDFLDRALNHDPDLKAEIQSVLDNLGTAEEGVIGPPSNSPLDDSLAHILDMGSRAELGDYEILRELGRGGRGIVHLARQKGLDRLVALKTLTPAAELSSLELERFRREANAIAKLRHPAIVPVFAFGEDRGSPYIVMEYVPGKSLAQELDLARAPVGARGEGALKGRLRGELGRPERIAMIVMRAAEAVEHAHSRGIVHRDIKPHNILLDEQMQPRLVDFGIARDEHEPSITKSGDIQGTPYYMSPEQVHAHRLRVDHRTDVYSLGVVLYELLTLQRPFEAPSIDEVMHCITTTEPRRVRRLNPNIPRDLETICHKAMQKRAADRYPTAAALAEDLRRFVNHLSIQARPPSWLTMGIQLAYRRRRSLTAAALLLLGGLGSFAHSSYEAGRALRREREQLEADLLRPPTELVARHGLLRRARDFQADHPEHGSKVMAHLVPQLREELRVEIDTRAQAFGQQLSLLLGGPGAATGMSAVATARRAAEVMRAAEASWDPDRMARIWDEFRTLAAVGGIQPETAASLKPAFGVSIAFQVDAQPDGGPIELAYRRVNPITGTIGELHVHGEVGYEPIVMQPGLYRFVLRQGQRAFCEIQQRLERRQAELTVEGRIMPTEAIVSDMIAIDGGVFEQRIELEPLPGSEQPHLLRRKRVVPSFYVDRWLVSNAEYAEYLEATAYRTPVHWPSRVPEPHWADHPVTNLSYSEAEAYARWRGKRLPTLAEWEFAARSLPESGGARLQAYPWADGGLGEAAPLPEIVESELRRERGRFQAYLDDVWGRSEAPLAEAGPNGLRQTFGSVWEWTATPYRVFRNGRFSITEEQYVVGGAWKILRLLPGTPDLGHKSSHHANMGGMLQGFRCVKSRIP